jgi:hypothetical protein
MSDEKKLPDEELDKVSGGTRVNPDMARGHDPLSEHGVNPEAEHRVEGDILR